MCGSVKLMKKMCQRTPQFLLGDFSLKNWFLETLPIRRSQFKRNEVHLVRKKSEEQATGRAWRPEKGEEQDKGRQSEGGPYRRDDEAVEQCRLGWGWGERKQIYVTS